MASRFGCATAVCWFMTSSTTCQMSGNRIRRSKNAATAISFAAFITAGNVPPVSPARRAKFNAGKSSQRGVENSNLDNFEKSSGGKEFGTRSGQVTAYWIGKHMLELLNCASVDPSANSTIE